MSKVIAGITTSVDGYVAGPDDGPGKGLGEGGERLHYWVFGGPWSYGADPSGEMLPDDKAWMDEAMGRLGGDHRGPLDLRSRRALGRHESVGPAVLHRHAPAGGAAAWRSLHVRGRPP
jgi:hypothetical protein